MSFSPGNLIRIVNAGKNGERGYFHTGDYAILAERDKDGDWWADFMDETGEGVKRWCVGDNSEKYNMRFELADDEEG